MSDIATLIARLSPEKQRLLAELLGPAQDPIAIIGMACRFPGGAESPEAFWQMLRDGVDAVSEIPKDRWNVDDYYDPDPNKPGKMTTRSAAFLRQIDQFDASFFGISPREAVRMDPQHRLLLEVSCDALDNAGQPFEKIAGSQTGVFSGLTTMDYLLLQIHDGDNFDGHAVMGSAHCTASGRVSHFLDLCGPNVAVDTACSSSLVAVHLACQSLRTKECNMALAGGVNIMASPLTTASLTKWNVLAPDGRCKTFDAAANGFARGEGCGMVVLKRLSDALADGDNILALIPGSAINQDGRTTRFSAPSGPAQQAVVRKALESAGLSSDRITMVETHGTGTALGDPIEVEALTAVLGQPRPHGQACALGAVKASIGHLEAAAGVCALIKTVLCIRNQAIPPQLHLTTLNPNFSLDNTPFYIARELTAWPQDPQGRCAGVSSFGLSGTNSHVIVQEAPPVIAKPDVSAAVPDRAYVLPISARSEPALQALAQSYRTLLSGDDSPSSLHDLCYTASLRRTHHPYRLAVVGRSRDELSERLETAAQDTANVIPCFPGSPQKLAFVFSGQGCQWIGMGRELLEQEPIFRQVIERCESWLKQHAGWSLLAELAADESKSRLNQTEVAQPAIFAIQVGLVELYRSWGIMPDVVVGHSAGEVAAAYTAGVLSLEDALRVTHHRARLMQRATGQGRMAAVGLSPADAQAAIAGHNGSLSVAAINGPASTVLSGEPAALAQVLATLTQRGVFCKDLGVNYAFHTRQMEPILPELLAALEGLQPRAASLPIVSSVTGKETPGVEFGPSHWTRNVREAVHFSEAIDVLIDERCNVFLEIGPQPVLATPLSQCLRQRDVVGTIISSLRQGPGERSALLRSVGALFAAGCELDWRSFYPQGGRCVDLPAYAWQRKRYWLSVDPPAAPVQPTSSTPTIQLDRGQQPILEYYDRISEHPQQDDNDSFLTFAPFVQPIPGFSWIMTAYEPEKHQEEVELIKQAQRELRSVLFRGIDFSSIRNMLDFGCGYGSDLLTLGERHPHLRGHGYTLSSKQAERGNRKARTGGLQDRVCVYQRDSSKDEFPGQYDLVFGFEVAHYVRDKHKLFSNIDRHLNDGGFIVLADFVANTVSEIGHAATSSYIITLDQWTELLSEYKLRVVECVDVSQEMGNFLHDANAEANLARLSRELEDDRPIRDHLSSYDGLGKLFRKKLASYTLFTIQKDRYRTREEIARINREKIASQTPYTEILRRDGLAATTPTVSASLPNDLGEMLWTLDWQAKLLPASNGAVNKQPGSWLILADSSGVGRDLADLLRQRGDTCITISRGADFQCLAPDRFQVNPARPEDFRELLADALTPDLPPCRGLIHLWGLDLTPSARTTLHSLQTDQALACGSLLHLSQAAASVQWAQSPRLWIATRGAQPTDDAMTPALAQGPLWGLGRTLAIEQPALWGGLIDFDPKASSRAAAGQLLEELLHGDGEDQVARHGDQRQVLRFQKGSVALRASRSETSNLKIQIVSDASYLLTGGLGGLGSLVAAWLVRKGARHLVLVQRSPLPPRSTWSDVPPESRAAQHIAAIRELEAAGAQVHCFAVDVAREEELARVLNEVRQSVPPLRGIVHTAGLLDDGVLSQLNWERFERVLAPKLWGAWNLHRLTLSDPLDFFVLFSSAASMFGSPGQANYAAANAALDTLAAYRRQQGLPALSLNWGPWAEVGMAAADAKRGGRVAQHGIASIAPATGIQVLEALLAQDRAQVGVVPLDIEQLRRTQTQAALRPCFAALLGEAVRAPAAQQPSAAPPASAAAQATLPSQTQIRQQLVQLEPAQRRPVLQAYLVEQTAKILQLSPKEVDARRPLNSLGIDSLMAVELRNRIESDLSVGVPIVSFLEGGSLADLIEKLLGDLSAAASPTPDDRMARALAQLNGMSDEAVKLRLAEKQQLVS